MVDKDVLENLEEQGIICYDEESDLPVKVEVYHHLREIEVCHAMLSYVVEDINISNRELARRLKINARTVGKHRSGDCFLRLLSEYTNRKMVSIRARALDELERELSNPKLNANTKAKFIAIALQHSEKLCELAMNKQFNKEVDVSALIKELETM